MKDFAAQRKVTDRECADALMMLGVEATSVTGDADTGSKLIKDACAVMDRVHKAADLELKAKAQETKEADLALAFFRGFSHVQPIWETDGTVREIAFLDSWKFLKRGFEWLSNPRCTGFTDDAQPTENARLVTMTRRRPIDYPALGLHIRHSVSSRDWGRFLERYALPKPAVIMHPDATNDQQADYLEGAQAVEQGQVSVWPSGASLTDIAGGVRGTDPFSAFIDHQEKQIVLLATGGTLMSLAESGSGTLAGTLRATCGIRLSPATPP